MPDTADRTPTIDRIRAVPLFSRLDEKHLATLAATAVEREYAPGDLIVSRGDSGVGFYLVAEGGVSIEKRGRTVATLGPGEFFGEMALLYEQSRSADVRAVGPTRCLVLSPAMFWGAVGDDPEALRTLLRETVRRLRALAPAPED